MDRWAPLEGDTLHLFAGFSTQPTGELALTLAANRGTATTLRVPLATQLTDGDLLPRLAAARRLPALDEDTARHRRLAPRARRRLGRLRESRSRRP